jgi:Zn-dependent M16 (insulinase) family peptidase
LREFLTVSSQCNADLIKTAELFNFTLYDSGSSKRSMRIIKKFINDKTKEGTVQLQAEQDEDMYSLYNLILAGDLVEASTIRNVIPCSEFSGSIFLSL